MEKLLQDWGFTELVPVFQEQEIDLEALLEIPPDGKILEPVLPKIGPRIKFMAKLKEYKMIMKSDMLLLEDIDENNEQTTPTTLVLTSPSTSNSNMSEISVVDDISFDDQTIKTAFQRASKRQLAFCGETQFKQACRNVYNLNIREFLGQSVPGKYIIQVYNKEKRLSRKTRNQLTSILISGLISVDGAQKLIPTDFEILAEKICAIFPTESRSTYYIPRVPGSKKNRPINAKGKLIDKYRNLCRSYNITNDIILENGDETTDENKEISQNGELNDQKLWLSKFQEPWDLVLIKWKSTFPLRKSDKSATLDEFISSWPILKHKEAYSLIDDDFQKLFPNCQLCLHHQTDIWDFFFEKFKKALTADTTTLEFLSQVSTDINQDSKNAIQIAALPMLCPPKGRIRLNQKTHWKPSILESQESLIQLVPTCANIQEYIQRRRTKLAEYKQPSQPYMIVVGLSFSDVTDSYLVIDNNFYRTLSVLHALDFTFKSFHAMNANYPKESEHVWLILEKSLFKIESSKVNIPAVLTVVQDIEQIV